MLLMCKNTPVFDVNNESVLCPSLVPGVIRQHPTRQSFISWMEKRYSERSNTFSRMLRGYVFGQGSRKKINEQTRAFSLSDCYWLKEPSESILFENVSPYYTDFWKGEGHYTGKSIPTLYVNGYISKQWLSSTLLFKEKEKHEVFCSALAKNLGISTVHIEDYDNGIVVHNFTSPDIMFESAEVSGRLSPEDFTTEDVLKEFGVSGFDMLFFDALIANGDRHAGNFGYLRNSNNGEYISMAPLFDFDHAFESKNLNDILIKEVRQYRDAFKSRFDDLVSFATRFNLDTYLHSRLESIISD